MSIPFRVKALELSTTKKDEPTDRRTFHEGLNLLIGDPGSGKSTVVELIRFGLGVQYQRTLVMNKVEWVLVEIVVGRRHLGLKRWARPSRHVTVTDLDTREELGTYPIKPSDGELGIGTALLKWLGIPSHVKVKLGTQSRPVTFEDVWKYMHVRQTEIHHSIARHDTSSGSKALRKRIFDLLFGLIDEHLMSLEAVIEELGDKEKRTREDLRGVESFRRTVGPSLQEDHLVRELSEARCRRRRLLRRDERLRSSPAAHDDRVVALRGLLTTTRDALARTDEEIQRLEETQRQRRTRSEELTAALTRMNRTRTAHALLAPIEFDRCPRCLQALAEHRADPGTCLVCLQDISEEEPDRSRRGSRSCDDGQGQLPFSIHGEDPAQKHQLDHQREDIRLLLEQGEQEKQTLRAHRAELSTELRELEDELHTLTSPLGFPGSEELVHDARQMAEVDAEIQRLEELLSMVEEAKKFTTAHEEAKRQLEEAQQELSRYQQQLDPNSESLIGELTNSYRELVEEVFAAPNAHNTSISADDLLPRTAGEKFDVVSISGGNRVPFIVGYWLALHEKALSSPNHPFPGFLILDSLQNSLGPRQELSRNMYRYIQDMATRWKESFQIFVLDTDLPDGFVPSREHTKISYEEPGIRSLPHPDADVSRP